MDSKTLNCVSKQEIIEFVDCSLPAGQVIGLPVISVVSELVLVPEGQ